MPAQEGNRAVLATGAVASVPRLMCLVSSRDDLGLLPALVAAGVDGFQVRDKDISASALIDLTDRVMTSGVTVLVNDRLDIALAAGAHGVHLGAEDLPVAYARRLAPHLLIGATCRDRIAIQRAAHDGADYAGVGPVFATTSKAGLPDPLGPGALEGLGRTLPVLAIGGIAVDNVAPVAAAGVHGVAVIGGIWSALDPVAAARALAQAVTR